MVLLVSEDDSGYSGFGCADQRKERGGSGEESLGEETGCCAGFDWIWEV